jgi:hypothetical protein
MFGYGYGVGITPNIASLGVAYDADAAAYFTAAGITDPTEKSAYNDMVVSLKANSLYTKFQALYPFLGGSATTHKYNAINPLDTDAAFRLSFVGGWTHSSTGAKPNGTTGYADTFYNNSTNGSQNDMHISYYSRTTYNGGVNLPIGVSDGASARTHIHSPNLAEPNGDCYVNGNSGFTGMSWGTTSSLRYFLASRTTSTLAKSYTNGVYVATSAVASVTPPNYKIFIGARNNAGAAQFFSPLECAFASIGTGLTDADVTALYTIIQTFQTALSRNI